MQSIGVSVGGAENILIKRLKFLNAFAMPMAMVTAVLGDEVYRDIELG